VYDGDPCYPRKGHAHPHPISGSCLLLPNGWMDQDATWYGGERRPRRRCVRWGRSCPLKEAQSQAFGSCLLCPNGSMDEDATWYTRRPRSRPHCIRRGPKSARKGHSSPPLFSAHVYCGNGRPSQLLLSSCYIFLL